MDEGTEILIYCNPSAPEEFKVKENMGTFSNVMFFVTGIFVLFVTPICLYCFAVFRKEKKMKLS